MPQASWRSGAGSRQLLRPERHADAARRGKTSFPPARRSLVDAADLPWLLQLAGGCRAGQGGQLHPAAAGGIRPHGRCSPRKPPGRRGPPGYGQRSPPGSTPSSSAVRQKHCSDASSKAADPAGRLGQRRRSTQFASWTSTTRASSDTSAFEELLGSCRSIRSPAGASILTWMTSPARPGIRLLPPGWAGQLGEAAWNYLHQPTPPGPDLLDRPGRLPWPAEAGYLALAHLVRHEAPGRTLAMLDGQLLARWAAPILAYPESATPRTTVKPSGSCSPG